MEKNVEMCLLLDFYGDFLTDRQKSIMDLHYNEDLSLGEIAEKEGITRQGVFDIIKRSETLLNEMEQKLGLLRQYFDVSSLFDYCIDELQNIDIDKESAKKINDVIDKLKKYKERLG